MTINQIIPDFELQAYQDDQIKKIRLSDYRGRWLVLLFYPADFTFICPTELEEAARLYKDFAKEGAELLSISTDTVYVHKAWHEHSKQVGKITFPMVADPTGRVARAFGTYIEEEGVSLRASFIIDPDGKMQVFEMHSTDIGRNIQEILRKLQAANFIYKNKGKLICPVNWKPGDKAIKKNATH